MKYISRVIIWFSVLAPYMVGIHVQGSGMLADLYRTIGNALKPLGFKMDVDNIPCLPDPIPPDFRSYIQIGTVTTSVQ
jgi:hypothetical protein